MGTSFRGILSSEESTPLCTANRPCTQFAGCPDNFDTLFWLPWWIILTNYTKSSRAEEKIMEKVQKLQPHLKWWKWVLGVFLAVLKGGEKISSVQVPFSSSKINWISPLDWEDFEHFLGNWDDRVLVLLCDRYWMTAWSLRYWNSMLSISSVGTPYIFTRSDAEPRKKPIFSLVVVFPKSGGHQERDVSLEDSLTLK